MKELYISASVNYGFSVEIPDDCDKNTLLEIISKIDPLHINQSNVDASTTYSLQLC